MGREIRRVPANWEHPKNEKGDYIPMYDKDYESAAKEWLENCILWSEDKHPAQQQKSLTGHLTCKHYWEYNGPPPDDEEGTYRPKFLSKPINYQIYENVSEGTPVSPVFLHIDGLINWLVSQGHNQEAAEKFSKSGHAPSMVIADGKLLMGIDACEKLY